MLNLSMYEGVISGHDMEKYTFRMCYLFVCANITMAFQRVCEEASKNEIPEEFIKEVIAKMEKEKLSNIVDENAKDNPDFHTKKEIKRI